jgi:valine--pyruvate aminotransferase
MQLQLSKFGRKISTKSGILELMDDLGKAMATASPGLIMLGGGNPAPIPQMQDIFRARMQEILQNEPQQFNAILGNYDTPQGRPEFILALAELLRTSLGWPVGPENIAVSNGSQSGFFTLFNLLAGEAEDGSQRKIFIPLMPEYIGYADQGLSPNLFSSLRPTIEERGPHEFKYRVDFDHLQLAPNTAAIAVSRPTNPTGNVLTLGELQKLSTMAKARGIPLIVDNAYGFPFPNIIFTEPELPVWEEHMIYSFSLSKIGLPGARTGVIIAAPEVVRALGAANAVISLANGNLGQALASGLLRTGKLVQAAKDIVRPFYAERAQRARDAAYTTFDCALPWRLHVCEGALFFWLWMRDLPITAQQLYDRLKKRNVLVVPGNYFFFGLDSPWRHSEECIRINYSQAPEAVSRGLQIIGEEMRTAYAERVRK